MAGAIQFNQVPGNIRVPFIRIEVNAGAAPFQSISRLLLFGVMAANGLATPGVPTFMSGPAEGLFGNGSMASSMYNTARLNGPFQEIWVCGLAAPAGATAAAGSILIKGLPSAPGTMVFYIGGKRVPVVVNTLMTEADIATALAAAITACAGIEVTGVVDGTTLAKVDITAISAGTLGNTILIQTQLAVDDGTLADELCTIVQLTNGAGDPDVADALLELGEDQWDFLCCPWADSSHLDEIDAFLANRWSPMSMTYGLHVTAKVGTPGVVLAFTAARNSQFSHILPMNNGPQGIHNVAAAFACQAAVHLQSPPELSRPLQSIALLGIRPPKSLSDRPDTPTRQAFYYSGASGYVVQSGVVQIDRMVSTYQRDADGNPDASFLDINTLAQLMYGLRSLSAYVTETYPRAVIVNSNPDAIQGFVTTTDLKNALVHQYKTLESIGVFQDSDTFAQLVDVERNGSDVSRADVFLPTEGADGLRVLAINATSYLQYPAS
jgi:phage tail sheath gpL-like